MGANGRGVDGVDVTISAAGIPATTAAASANGASAGSAATVTVAAGTANSGLAEDFAKLNGTLTLDGKTLDLSTVTYDPTAGSAARMTTLNKAVQNVFGTSVTAASGTGGTFVFTGPNPGANATTDALADSQLTFTRASGATDALKNIDAAIKTVSTTRADLGALQNRFDHTINNLNVSVENLTASESRIRDADMAQEMVQFTRNQILSQAGTSMLAQANQASQGVLSLLR